jgi:uncharacterized protein YraI
VGIRIVRVLVVAVVLMLAATPSVLAAPPGQTTMVVNSPLGVNLRSGTTLTSPVILVLRNGETVTVSGDPVWSQGIRWMQTHVVRWGVPYDGYSASAYLGNYPGYNEPTDSWTDGTGLKVIASDGLRLRSGPGLVYYVKRIVPYGAILKKTGADGVDADGYTWIELKYGGSTGWAAKQYLQKVGQE